MAARTRLLLAGLALGIITGLPPDAAPTAIRGATAGEAASVGWALDAYERAGLELPDVEFAFHDRARACAGGRGLYLRNSATVHICARNSPVGIRRHLLLHELAHAFTFERMDDSARATFVERNRMNSWNRADTAWVERGAEIVAEVVAWAVSDDPAVTSWLAPVACDRYRREYRNLTGSAPSQLATKRCLASDVAGDPPRRIP